MSLLSELKRRNVIRVAILYFVSSWLLLQLTDVLSSILPVPQWTGSFVFTMLLIGLAPALIFSWVYELTPDGLRRESDIDSQASISPDTGRKINTAIVALLALAIAGMIADRLIPEEAAEVAVAETASAVVAVAENTIAVLPFADLSEEGDQRFFTDGLSEELLNLLVRVDGLHVASRTSAFSFRNTSLSIPEIAGALGVAHVLEGSVRKSGNKIRITAQLIEAGTDRHIWSENFDRDLDDIFVIQDEIGNSIVAALKDKMHLSVVTRVAVEASTENMDAYALYLEARELFIKRERLLESKRLYLAAIELDPGFARAWEGLAATEAVLDDWVYDDGVTHLPHASMAAKKALELNPELSMPYAVLGSGVLFANGGRIVAEDYYLQAIEKDSKNTTALLWHGLLLKELGLFQAAEQQFEACLEIDPGYQNCKQHRAHSLLLRGEKDEAMRLYEETLEWNFHSMSEAFVPILVRDGRRELALTIADIKFGLQSAPVIEWIRAVENPDGDNSVGNQRLKDWARNESTGVTYNTFVEVPLAFRDYDAMLDSSSFRLGLTLWHPHAAHFRQAPQFRTFIRESTILAYWQARGFPGFCRPKGDDDFECDEPAKPAKPKRLWPN